MDKGKQPEILGPATDKPPHGPDPSVTAADADSAVKFGGMDAEDESVLPLLGSVPRDCPPSYQSLQGTDSYYPSNPGPPAGLQATPVAAGCSFTALPAELLDNILSYLSPIDLSAVSQTCHHLYKQATADFHWQNVVQAHVPGYKVTSPYPCDSFRDLWAAHDPRWFLPKYKIWFSGQDLTGKVILVRYDQRRGCIEGYQLVATRNKPSYRVWETHPEVIMHSFEPTVNLHLDRPVLHLRCETKLGPAGTTKGEGSATGSDSTADGAVRSGWESHGQGLHVLRPNAEADGTHRPSWGSRYAEPVSMTRPGNIDGMFSSIFLSKAVPESTAQEMCGLEFPYGQIWPPPRVPARHRFAAAESSCHLGRSRGQGSFEDTLPSCRNEISDQGFRIRTWLEMRPALAGILRRRRQQAGEDLDNPPSQDDDTITSAPRIRYGAHLGEETTTYSTLDPALYTPTADCPWRGIWVGDYSGHGCEFLLVHQTQDDDSDGGRPEDAIIRAPSETDEAFEARRRDARVHRGRLEAVKLTGDPNVPRGEISFVVEDMGAGGFVEVLTEEPFEGVRMVKSKGHVAASGFRDDKYIESRLLLISHDKLAQYWLDFGHMSFFRRVEIDKLLQIT